MQNKVTNCPICLKRVVPRFLKQHNHYKINRCPDCDVVYSEPFRSPGAIWYEYLPFLSFSSLKIPVRWQFRLFLTERHRLGGKLLDLGCGNGLFLHYAKERGYRVVGIDFNSSTIEEGRRIFGLKNDELLCTTPADYASRDEKFDIVTMFEVLEHIDNPNEVMENIKKKLLKPNGILALTVPNPNRFFDFLGEWDNPPMHLTTWSSKALIRFIESHGFEVIVHKIKPVDGLELTLFIEVLLAGNIKQILIEKFIKSVKDSKKSNKSDPRPILWKLLALQLSMFSFLFHPLAVLISLLGKEGEQQYLLAKLKAHS